MRRRIIPATLASISLFAAVTAAPASAACGDPELTPRLEVLERTCVAGAPCTLPLLLDLAPAPDTATITVASATVTSDMDFDCDACAIQTPAGLGACTLNSGTCAGVFGDPFEANLTLGEGVVAEIEITCNDIGTHSFDLASVSFGGTNGLPVPGCGRASAVLCTACDGTATCGAGQTCDPDTGACIDEPAAFVSITNNADLSASTFASGSMSVTNNSGGSIEIDAVRIDLRPTVLPDMVFDPVGIAGDVVAKCLSPGGTAAAVGFVDPTDPCVDPFSSGHDGGFDVMDMAFTDFQPGEQFKFSVDIDPTSIQGTAAAAGSGSVAGVELSGARYTIDFSDGSSVSGRIFRTSTSQGGANNEIRLDPPGAPSLEALDAAAVPGIESNPTQTLRLRGLTPGSTARVLHLETEMDLNGRVGFMPEPFEGNEALSTTEYSAIANASGVAEVTATLTRSRAGGGINYFQAVEVDGDGSGRTGGTSNVLVLELDPSLCPDPDGDDICAADDNCPTAVNTDQADTDGDQVGDACDVCTSDGCNDEDLDGICNGNGYAAPATGDRDNCATLSNPGQANVDGDALGDTCDLCPNDAGIQEDLCLGTGDWSDRAASPKERSESGLVELGGLLYVIGGEQTDTNTSVDVYDPATDTWLPSAPDLPAPRHHIQPVVVKDKIYVIGGLQAFPGPSFANVWVYDPNEPGDGWIAMSPMPTARGAHGCAADGVRIYCAGGLSSDFGNTAVDVFEVYNTVTDEWSMLPPMPRPKDHAWAQIIDAKFYSAGGRDTTIGSTYAFNDVYDIVTGTWSLGAPLPTPRGGHAAVVYQARLLVIGGEGNGPSSGTFPDVEEYDPARDVWRSLTDVPTPRHGITGAVSRAGNGTTPVVYTIGGGPSQGASKSDAHEAFSFNVCSSDADCDDSDECTVDTCTPDGCENAPISGCGPHVWIRAATDPTADFNGSMTTGPDFTGGADVDPDADSLTTLMVFADSASSGGSGTGDKVTYDIDIPEAGQWYAWGRFYYPGGPPNDANSFWLQVDAGTVLKFGNNKNFYGRFHWDGNGANENGTAEALSLGQLGAGPHTLMIKKREVSPVPPRLEMICLTNDPAKVPTDADALEELARCVTDADCDDANPCTDEVCDATRTCITTPNAAACDDGLFCTENDACAAGICSGAPTDCTDADACTVDGCDEAGDTCTHDSAADGVVCDDGDFCTVTDTCASGVCGGLPRDCSDGNSCTVDACDEALNTCSNPPVTNNVLCDDGISCTATDVCMDGVCIGSDGCPVGETCDLPTGQCITSDPCTIASECDDGNECTDDDCVNDFCSFQPNNAPCDDGQFCTVDDSCASGSCGGGARDCSDGVDCTTDVCNDALDECIPVPRDLNCDDLLFCNGVENCDEIAGCEPGTPVDCSTADSVCGAGFCDEAADSCSVNPLNDGTSCDDDDLCSASETCSAGECTGPMSTNIVYGKLKMKSKPGDDNDKLTLTMKLPLAEYTEDPASEGAGLTILGCDGTILYASDVPAGGFLDLKGNGTDIRFRDKNGLFASARGLRLLRFKQRRRAAEIKIQGRLGRGDVDGQLTQACADVSVIIGEPSGGICIGGFGWVCNGSPDRLRCNLD